MSVSGKYKYMYSITDTCQRIHGSINGTSDQITDAELAEHVAFLKMRLEVWEPTWTFKHGRIDECYRQLILATLHLADIE
jgi:hypothetical protein